jgi:hypothetical protein
MPPLPERYGESVAAHEEKVGHIVTNNGIATLSMCVGACGIAVMSISTTLKTNDLFYFAEFLFALFSMTQIVTYATAAAFTAGAVSFFIALAMGFAALLNFRKTMLFFLVAVFAVSVAEIAIGVVVKNGVDSVINAIYASVASGTLSDPGSLTFNIIIFQLAMFNACCAPNGWSRENAPANYDPANVNKYTYLPPFLGFDPAPYYVPACLVINDTALNTGGSKNWVKKTSEHLQCYRDQETCAASSRCARVRLTATGTANTTSRRSSTLRCFARCLQGLRWTSRGSRSPAQRWTFRPTCSRARRSCRLWARSKTPPMAAPGATLWASRA